MLLTGILIGLVISIPLWIKTYRLWEECKYLEDILRRKGIKY